MADWYRVTLHRLIEVCSAVTSKYTRSKVRKALPRDFEYIIDELLNVNGYDRNKEQYYENIISSIIDVDRSEAFIAVSYTHLDVYKRQDYVIDLGPEGGDHGGTLIAQGSPEEVAEIPESYTGQYLKKVLAHTRRIAEAHQQSK